MFASRNCGSYPRLSCPPLFSLSIMMACVLYVELEPVLSQYMKLPTKAITINSAISRVWLRERQARSQDVSLQPEA